MVAVPVPDPLPLPVPVNLADNAPLFTATTTTGIPANDSTSVHVDMYTPVDPAHVPTKTTANVAPALLLTTTNFLENIPKTVSPAPDPTITINVPANPPTTFVPEF